jgi:hypothetical protein
MMNLGRQEVLPEVRLMGTDEVRGDAEYLAEIVVTMSCPFDDIVGGIKARGTTFRAMEIVASCRNTAARASCRPRNVARAEGTGSEGCRHYIGCHFSGRLSFAHGEGTGRKQGTW